MGKTKEVLAEKEIKHSHYYPTFFTIEVCENFHIHWRNTRIQFLKPEWKVFAPALTQSHNKWKMFDEPYPSDETIYLHPAWSKLPLEGFGHNRMAIELQDVHNELPEIHFHYRNIRIDLNKEELKEMVALFKEAETKLNNASDEGANDKSKSL